jgi:hypothetical protein
MIPFLVEPNEQVWVRKYKSPAGFTAGRGVLDVRWQMKERRFVTV